MGILLVQYRNFSNILACQSTYNIRSLVASLFRNGECFFTYGMYTKTYHKHTHTRTHTPKTKACNFKIRKQKERKTDAHQLLYSKKYFWYANVSSFRREFRVNVLLLILLVVVAVVLSMLFSYKNLLRCCCFHAFHTFFASLLLPLFFYTYLFSSVRCYFQHKTHPTALVLIGVYT